MDVRLSQEQQDFARSCRDSLATWCPTSLVREVEAPQGSGHSPELWEKMAKAGWLDVVLPNVEEHDEDAPGLIDAGLVFREAGRALVPTTLASTVFAGHLLAQVATTAQRDTWLRQIQAGKVVATVAVAERTAAHDPASIRATAFHEADGWVLRGEKAFVPNFEVSQLALVGVRIAEAGVPGPFGFVAISPSATGITAERHSTFGNDSQSRVQFDDTPILQGGPLGANPDSVRGGYRRAIDIAAALTAMEMVGGTEAVLDQTVDYVKTRIAFNKPIGSFQAVQHHLANVAIALKGAELLTFKALWQLDAGLDATRAVSMAKAWAGKTFRDTTLIAHQLWGGMGYMRETDLHLWSNRAVTLDSRHGGYSHHVRRVATTRRTA